MDVRNPLDSYEQLKRKNRRRLVGAVVMVAAAGGLLLAVSGQNETPVAETQQLVDSSGAPVADAAPQGLPENGGAASDTVGGVVLEPAPGADEGGHKPAAVTPPSAAGGGETRREGKVAVSTDVKPPLPQRPQEAAPQPEPKTEAKPEVKPAEKSGGGAPAKPETPPVRTEPKAADKAETRLAPKAEIKPETKPEPQAPVPTVVFKPKDGQNEGKAAKPAKPAAAPKTKAPGRTETRKPDAKLTPQEILNNKAAGQVGGANGKAAKQSDPQAILDGKTGGRAQVQVGAYASEQQAQSVQQKLAAAGVETTISASETSKGTVYRVRTATYDNRAQAEQALKKIRAQGLGGMVVSR